MRRPAILCAWLLAALFAANLFAEILAVKAALYPCGSN
jgi:hypothetical protein